MQRASYTTYSKSQRDCVWPCKLDSKPKENPLITKLNVESTFLDEDCFSLGQILVKPCQNVLGTSQETRPEINGHNSLLSTG